MFGISIYELIIILLVIILLFNPKDIVSFIKNILDIFRNLKNQTEKFKQEVNNISELNEHFDDFIIEYKDSKKDKHPDEK